MIGSMGGSLMANPKKTEAASDSQTRVAAISGSNKGQQ
jgi:hypothetical protein